MKATGTWVILKDPREKQEESIIQLLDETKKRMQEESEDLNTNILEVVSAGEHCRDKELFKPGSKVILDPRMPVAVINTSENEEEFVLVVQENQVMMVL